MPEKSSFVRREISEEDAVIQVFRPLMQGQVTQSLDVFERLVADTETLVKLGTKLQLPGKAAVFLTPGKLRANLDEFGELETIAEKGRAFLNAIGFVSPRRSTPLTGEGTAPVGKTVDVQPITVTRPGSEPLAGAVVAPKKAQHSKEK